MLQKDVNKSFWTCHEKLMFFLKALPRCLKITEKGLTQHCVHILSGKKLIKNAQNCSFWRVFENLKLEVIQCYQTGQF